MVDGEMGFFVHPAFRGRRRLDLARRPDRVEVAGDRRALVVRNAVLLRAAHEHPGDRHPPSRNGDMAMNDELPRLTRRECESLQERQGLDRKSTRLNSSHSQISYAVFCLKKKKKKTSMTY